MGVDLVGLCDVGRLCSFPRVGSMRIQLVMVVMVLSCGRFNSFGLID
jgi:hypothetical protein